MNPTRYRWASLGATLATLAGLLACGMVLGLTWGQASVAGWCPGVPGAPCTQTAQTLGSRIWLMTFIGLPTLGVGLGGHAYLRKVVG